jgi:hypothetical protein
VFKTVLGNRYIDKLTNLDVNEQGRPQGGRSLSEISLRISNEGGPDLSATWLHFASGRDMAMTWPLLGCVSEK